MFQKKKSVTFLLQKKALKNQSLFTYNLLIYLELALYFNIFISLNDVANFNIIVV
jgi:hypothetical protein